MAASRPAPDLSEALDWKPGADCLSGRAANLVIGDALHELDRAFAAHMGQPPVPSLLTYAKHASRTVGVQVARLEAALRFLRFFDLNALVDVMRDARSRPALRGHIRPLLAEAGRNPLRLYGTLQSLRRGILWGNLQAYESLVPAFRTYLDAASGGGDGVAALYAAGYGGGGRDPQGLVVHAFKLYDAARRLGTKPNGPGGSRAGLADVRHALAFHATLTLSLHEQMLFQTSECYEDPVVRRVVEKMTPSLVIEDPVDTMRLLPDGGNWADFTDRIGLAEVSAGEPADLGLIDPGGTYRRYRISSAAARPGTIFDYLSSRFLDPNAAAGVAARPLPLPAYDDGEGRAVDRLRQTYRRATGTYHPDGVLSDE